MELAGGVLCYRCGKFSDHLFSKSNLSQKPKTPHWGEFSVYTANLPPFDSDHLDILRHSEQLTCSVCQLLYLTLITVGNQSMFEWLLCCKLHVKGAINKLFYPPIPVRSLAWFSHLNILKKQYQRLWSQVFFTRQWVAALKNMKQCHF